MTYTNRTIDELINKLKQQHDDTISALNELKRYTPNVPKFKVQDYVTFKKDVKEYNGDTLLQKGTYIIVETGSLYTLQDNNGGCIIVAQDTVETFGE